ncbi:MAG TPA: hypothetical protein VGQ17_07715 [Gemmatimonadales bacterium]|jgi:hypothetical protein|nr:hypothetical protein [Gemmatimonadales bacterium]
MRALNSALAASVLLLGAITAARAQTPNDSARRGETERIRSRIYWPHFEYRLPRMRFDTDRIRMQALERSLERADRLRDRQLELQSRLRGRQFELQDRLRDRRFELQDRLWRRQFDRQDQVWRRNTELHDRLMDRMHERMDRLHELRPFIYRRHSRTI